MNIEELRVSCINLRNATECMPFGDDTLVFKVEGKIFCLVSLDTVPTDISVKCDPERALELREQYQCVIPGRHLNKKHWNTVTMDGSIKDSIIEQWIKDSYQLVVDGLPSKLREGLTGKINLNFMENISEILSSYKWENLEDRIQFELDSVVEKEAKQAYCVENMSFCVSCMDYTTLKPTDTEKSVATFVEDMLKKQKKYNLPDCAAVCVFPNFAAITRKALEGTPTHTAVVAAGFPASQTFIEIKNAECKHAIAAGAEEVDIVISVGDVLEGNYQKAYDEICAIRNTCKKVHLKVILETGELKTIDNVFKASIIAMYAGADFIKTSTGKVSVNATPEAVFTMCEAVKQFNEKTGKKVGIKVAGGVSKTQNALQYMTIVSHVLGKEWLNNQYFRIGTSQLLDNVIRDIQSMQ